MLPPPLCSAVSRACEDVAGFLANVPSANEESLTDYLLWKWNEADRFFRSFRTTKYTHHKEATKTGADFAVELWIVGAKTSIPILFQAKKFTRPFDSYAAKLGYPSRTQKQIKLLRSYASSLGCNAYYAIYTTVTCRSAVCARHLGHKPGTFALDASQAEIFASLHHRKRLSLSEIIGASRPFPCLFCCPAGTAFPRNSSNVTRNDSSGERPNSQVPSYVWSIRNRENTGMSREDTIAISEASGGQVGAVAVWDIGARESAA